MDANDFERSLKRKQKIPLLIGIVALGLLGTFVFKECKARNRQLDAREERRKELVGKQEERRAQKKERELREKDYRRERLKEDRSTAEELLTKTTESIKAALPTFVQNVAAAKPGGSCQGLYGSSLANSIHLPHPDLMRIFKGVDYLRADTMALSKNEYILSPSLRKKSGYATVVNFVTKPPASRSQVLANTEDAVRAARTAIQQGLYPEGGSWQQPAHNVELVLVMEEYRLPSAGPESVHFEFTPGIAKGLAVLYSHADQSVRCAFPFEAISSDSLGEISQEVALSSIANHFRVARAAAIDFERQIAKALLEGPIVQ